MIRSIRKLLNLDSRVDKLLKENIYANRVNFLNNSVINSRDSGLSDELYCKQRFVVSLTTYDKRLHDVYLTIESLMQQTRKANAIVLWLSDELEKTILPMSLQLLTKRGLEIRYCPDIRSYKKLIPSLVAFPEDVIITVDDDVLYDADVLDKLIIEYLKDPTRIYYNRGHKMKLDDDGSLQNYNDWDWQSSDMEASKLNFPTGVGGILYPPGSLDLEVLNEKVFMDICIYADDVWFKAMALRKGTLSKKVYTRNVNGEDFLENVQVQDIALGQKNNVLNYNDKQIKAVFEKYDLYKLL